MLSILESELVEYGTVGGGDPTKPYYYLAGPMTNIPDNNFPAFHAAADRLREWGYNVINPAQLDEEIDRMWDATDPDPNRKPYSETKTWKLCLRRDIPLVLDENCVGVFVLDGWEQSQGAQFETYVAAKLEVPLYEFHPYAKEACWPLDRKKVLRDAGIDD